MFLPFVVTKKKNLVHDIKFLKKVTIIFFPHILYTYSYGEGGVKRKSLTDKDF